MQPCTLPALLQEILKQKCKIDVENTHLLSEEEFALARRNGLGASDMSIVLGLQSKWNSPDELLKQKLAKEFTEQEKEISQKDNVRKGKDLEPMILQKFSNVYGLKCIKPTNMYRFMDFPYLTVNFDGITMNHAETFYIPVEAKMVSMFADKYWNWELAGLTVDTPLDGLAIPNRNIKEHCEAAAAIFGIPDYYYSQIQQQMMALDAPYGFFAALRDKTWSLEPFYVPADEWLQSKLITEGYQFWKRVEKGR